MCPCQSDKKTTLSENRITALPGIAHTRTGCHLKWYDVEIGFYSYFDHGHYFEQNQKVTSLAGSWYL
jgi:hypothetical protein